MPPVGILGLGAYVPGEVRTNAWWPADLVDGWRAVQRQQPPPAVPPDASEGVRRVAAAIAEQAPDPFQGTAERRVLPADEGVFDMEERAARLALERAAIDPRRIDLLLSYTVVPDALLSNPACILHRRLGLAPECFTMHTDAATYSFMMQLALAEAMISAGRATVALLVQSCVGTRLIDREDPGSVLMGDGAAAVVVGAVGAGRGILDAVHYTDGRFANSLVMSVPGGTWFDPGRPRLHVADRAQLRDVFLATADLCKRSVEAALARTGHGIDQVGFVCVHQGTSWLQRVVHDYIGFRTARWVETFTRFGYLMAAMIPSNLYFAETERQVRDDDLVVLAGGGTGMTYGAIVMRWGR